MTYEVTISKRGATRLAAVRHIGPYMEINTAFEQVSAWAMSRNLFNQQTQMIGIFWDDPQSVDEKDLKSDAGLTLPCDFAGLDPDHNENPVSIIDIPALTTASIIHAGPYAQLETAYRWIYSSWLPQSSREADDIPPFEEYLNDPKNTAPADLRTRIHIPIKS